MNIINKAFLQLALLPKPLYKKLGVDLSQLTAILNTKLTMDDRRLSPLQQVKRRSKDKPITSSTLFTIFISAVLGLMYILVISIADNLITGLTYYFSIFFLMLSATLISDFTSVLIDVRDTHIILPKPVNDRTVLMGRLLHIFIHICKIVVPMGLPGIIYIGVQYGIPASIYLLILIFLMTMECLFFINALYILILRFTSPQKFQNIISYFQVIFAIVIYGAFQLLPRLIGVSGMATFDLTQKNWASLLPPYWLASAWQVMSSLHGSNTQLAIAAIGLVSPFISIWVVIKFLAPAFINKLALINSSGDTTMASSRKVVIQKASVSESLASVLTRSPGERAGFLFAWKMMGRSRDFRLKVYPSIGYILVYTFVIFGRSKNMSLQNFRTQDEMGRILIISALYVLAFLLVAALSQMMYSEKYKASWIFHAAPIEYPGEIILGSVKAGIVKFYIPIVIILTIVGLILAGPAILPNIILGLFNELLIATLLIYMSHRALPFSMKQDNNNKSGSLIRSFGVLLISGLIALVHFFVFNITGIVILGILLSIIATWLMMGSIKKTGWEKVLVLEKGG